LAWSIGTDNVSPNLALALQAIVDGFGGLNTGDPVMVWAYGDPAVMPASEVGTDVFGSTAPGATPARLEITYRLP
jgi:hypothetical protein